MHGPAGDDLPADRISVRVPGPVRPAKAFDARQLWAVLLHRGPLALVVALLTVAAVMATVLTAKPTFLATASIVVEPRDAKVVTNPNEPSLPNDTSMVDTQVEIVKTPVIAERVVRRLKLYRDPEFNPKAPTGAAALAYTPSPAVMNVVVHNVAEHLGVRRIGLTYVIEVSFRSHSASKAATIVNTFVEEYLAQQIQGKVASTREANGWLNQSLAKLRNDSLAADSAVQQYIIAHNLMSADGQSTAEQGLTQLNEQLAAARADAAEKEGRLSSALSQMRGGDGMGAISGSDTIRELRKTEAEQSEKVVELNTTYGPKYPDVIREQNKLADIRREISEETSRVMSHLRSEASAARQRQGSLQSSLGAAFGGVASANRAQVDLIALKQKAEAARKVYEAYLDRADQLAAQDGVQLPNARFASRANAPLHHIAPRKRLAAAGAVVLGLVTGLLSIILAELWAGSVRTRGDVERKLDAPFAGIIPDPAKLRIGRKPKGMLPADYLVEEPFSGFAEAYRGLRALFRSWGTGAAAPRVIAVTSALPREGKSTIALCLTRALAITGSKVLLMDCDGRRSGLNALIGAPDHGLGDLLEGRAQLNSLIIQDTKTRALILPWGKTAPPKDLISAPALDEAIETLREEFDYLVIDTAPVLAAADARVLAAKADVALLVAEWNKTPVRAAAAAVDLLRGAGVRIAGVALNKVNVGLQARYGYGDTPYEYKAVAAYYAR
jgi:capsular exopolysaccharide synthesis family protein